MAQADRNRIAMVIVDRVLCPKCRQVLVGEAQDDGPLVLHCDNKRCGFFGLKLVAPSIPAMVYGEPPQRTALEQVYREMMERRSEPT